MPVLAVAQGAHPGEKPGVFGRRRGRIRKEEHPVYTNGDREAQQVKQAQARMAPQPSALPKQEEGHEEHGSAHEGADRVHQHGAARQEHGHGLQQGALDGRAGQQQEKGPEVGVKDARHRVGAHAAPEGAERPVHGDAHQNREQGRQRRAAEQAAAQDIIGEEVQEDAQRAHAQHVRGRVVPTGEEARQGSQQVGDARILREKRRHGVQRESGGAFRGLQDLRIVLQVAVHADAPGVEIQRPLQGAPAEQPRQQDQDQVRGPVCFRCRIFHGRSPSLAKGLSRQPRRDARSAAWCRAAFGAGGAGGCRHDLPRGLPVAHHSAK